MKLYGRLIINTILYEFHDSIYSEHLSEDSTIENVKNCSEWPSWRKETIEYLNTCDEFQNSNRITAKEFGFMVHIQEPQCLWDVVHMYWVAELTPSGYISYDACLVILERYRKTPIFLPFNEDDTAMDTAFLL
ncbi:hypothetical protein O181_004270 [Austropuccinia psidii MF-1]|uniref:Integrase zinc-binding domain-containing protein n=1 Tax=Austropuccinia psidii MF-1 TaxID=1389203 RepID=A0A9Q3BG22_9BASI|nr:hypothetical protein [Austropuccinia psidii MF-1]